MKDCPACSTSKLESEFGVNRALDDGLNRQCKACTRAYRIARGEGKPEGWERKTADRKAYGQAWRAENPEKCRGYEKNRPKCTPEQERAKYERRMRRLHGDGWVPRKPKTTEEKRATARARQKRKRAKGRVQWLARHRLGMAVKRGKITKLPCWTCGASDVEGHHPAYSLPLDVVWLCAEHHREVHVA